MLEQIYCSTHCLYQLDAELKKIKISDAIEIRASEVARTKKQSTFFNDVFRIELCDSMKNHLSMIDVSEIFWTIIENLTIEENKLLMKRMMRRYIENSRTTILAVLSMNIDIMIIEILDLTAKICQSNRRWEFSPSSTLSIKKQSKISQIWFASERISWSSNTLSFEIKNSRVEMWLWQNVTWDSFLIVAEQRSREYCQSLFTTTQSSR